MHGARDGRIDRRTFGFAATSPLDQVLPIDQCSRVIVPRLRSMGYDVAFREFDGRHELPPDVANEAMRWLAAV